VRVVVNEPPEDRLTVCGVFGGVQDMLVPEVVHLLRPGDHDLTGVRCDQVEELLVLLLGLVQVVPQISPPTLSTLQFFLYSRQIQILDQLPLLLVRQRDFLVHKAPIV
jgi:hypothetical protein